MGFDETEIAIEQDYFDRAWEERERKRRTISAAPASAAGPKAGAAFVRRGTERALERIAGPDEPVAFGRFDTNDGDSYYLGVHSISTEEQDLLVINWKQDVARPYYEATVEDAQQLLLRRKFLTDRNTILDIEEVIFADLIRKVGELTEARRTGIDDTVLRDLEADRTGEMRDIVQTIHAAQFALIRSPMERTLIVQGGPGTGKTAVALHRASWLLYQHQDELRPEQVLIVGPNPTFTRYIKSVLPGLGDEDVAHQDIRSLGPQASTGRAEEHDVARLKGEMRMADLLTRALDQRVRFPERTDVLEIGSEPGSPTLTRAEVEAVLPRLRTSSSYSAGRTALRSWISERAAQRSSSTLAVPPAAIDAALDRVWPPLTAQAFLRDLLGSRERLVTAAGDDFTAGDANRLLRPASERITEEQWTDADVALLDHADGLIGGQTSGYRHIVVDEAQDLSPMQLLSIRRRSANASFTVVGDLAQSTGAWARSTWDDVGEALAGAASTDVRELELGYRVPEQIFRFAAQILPFAAANITPPRIVRIGPADPTLTPADEDEVGERTADAAREYAGQGLFVGIVCPDSLREDVTSALAKQSIQWSDAGQGRLGSSINLARPVEAKGLEFDAVVVVEPEAIVDETEHGLRMLFVALTRTTRYLTVVHSGSAMPIPEPQSGTHRDPPTLEPAIQRPVEVADETAEEMPSPAEPAIPLSTSTSLSLSALASDAVSRGLAEQLRASVPPTLWAQVLDQARRELGIEGSEILDLLD